MKNLWILWLALWLAGCESEGSAAEDQPTDTTATAPVDHPAAALNKKYPLDKITLPPGFRIDIYAEVKNARSMVLSPDGTLFVGNRTEDKVYAVRDNDKNNVADQVFTVASGLKMPCGVAFKDGSLYVAEVSRILRFDNIEKNLQNPPKPVVVTDKLPKEEWHGWKFIAFGPDGKLYVPVGAPCNICEKPEKIYASIARMNPDGSGLEVFANGVRNTVGFAWHPDTKELWFTDNGGDNLGDFLPADELNRAPKAGMHFGFPYCHQGDHADPTLGAKRPCSEFTPPVQKLGAHVAALGMRFYTGTQFPKDYHKQIFIAEHGSWNRTPQAGHVGFKVSLVQLEGNTAVSYKAFAYGWLQGNEAWGRPADVLCMPDGALLVSDDRADVIYRISYKK